MYVVFAAVLILLLCGCALSCLLLVILSRRKSSVKASLLSTPQTHDPSDNNTQNATFQVLENSDDQKLFCAKWESVLKKFNEYTRATYPNDTRFINAQSKWTGKIYFFRAKSKDLETAMAFFSKGSIYVNANMFTTPGKGVNKTPNELPATTFLFLHELAHTNGAGHDDVWKDAFIAFLRVARDELKWGCSDQCAKMLSKNA